MVQQTIRAELELLVKAIMAGEIQTQAHILVVVVAARLLLAFLELVVQAGMVARERHHL
jgi:hypothetical protein